MENYYSAVFEHFENKEVSNEVKELIAEVCQKAEYNNILTARLCNAIGEYLGDL